jgi:hypothetical protein
MAQQHQIPAVAKNGLRILQHFLGLVADPTLPSSQDAVFIAIDFESLHNIKDDLSLDLDCQLGLAILDTRDFENVAALERIISTHNFATGSSKYCDKASKKFLFGKSDRIHQMDMLRHINSLIPPSCTVILLGHGMSHDLRALATLRFEFQTSFIVDTSLVVPEVLSYYALSLNELLTELQCPFNNLHCAGNDAHFTLRASLLLAIRDPATKIDTKHQNRMNILEEIAYAPIPNQVDPEVKARKRKEKRVAKSRKYQSRFWSTEKQEQIRAERALRKLESL